MLLKPTPGSHRPGHRAGTAPARRRKREDNGERARARSHPRGPPACARPSATWWARRPLARAAPQPFPRRPGYQDGRPARARLPPSGPAATWPRGTYRVRYPAELVQPPQQLFNRLLHFCHLGGEKQSQGPGWVPAGGQAPHHSPPPCHPTGDPKPSWGILGNHHITSSKSSKIRRTEFIVLRNVKFGGSKRRFLPPHQKVTHTSRKDVPNIYLHMGFKF